MIPVSRPYLDEREEQAVIEVMRSGWIGLGPKTEEFEEKFAKYVGSKYAVALNSCTSALHIACRLLNLKPGDEIIVPTNTFIITAQASQYEGAKPVMCDVRKDDLLIDWNDAFSRMTPRTKAFFPVLWAGQPLETPEEVALPVIYDCAQAMGADFDVTGKNCCWSFHAVKNMTTGDGGMFTTDSEEMYERAKKLRWFGINYSTWDRTKGNRSWEYDIGEFGFKYHMNDIEAVMGIVQLSKMEEMQMLRRQHRRHYISRLQDVVDFIPKAENSSNYLFVIRVPDRRNELSDYLRSKGIATGVHHKPIHLYPFYNEYSLPVAEREWQRILSLPIHPGLKESEVDHVCDEVIRFVRG
jgi:perosamine synthetase